MMTKYHYPNIEILDAQVSNEVSDAYYTNNKQRHLFLIADALKSSEFSSRSNGLPVILGMSEQGDVCVRDLSILHNLLIVGGVGQGVSNVAHTIITSLLYKNYPSALNFVIFDSKGIEYAIYNDLNNHFMAGLNTGDCIVSKYDRVISTLNGLNKEVEDRLTLFQKSRTRNIQEYITKYNGEDLNSGIVYKYLPYLVVVIDEFGDFASWLGDEFKLAMSRLLANGYRVGIYCVVVTQQFSKSIIGDDLRSMLFSKIVLRVGSVRESKELLNCSGAENLLSGGELLFSDGGIITKLQSPYVSTHDMNAICDFISAQQGFSEFYKLSDISETDSTVVISNENIDPLLFDVARSVVLAQEASVSMIQRRYSLGFNRAGRIMDQLEALGIIGPSIGNRVRDVYVTSEAELKSIMDSWVI